MLVKNHILNLIYEYIYKEIADDFFVDNVFGDTAALSFAKSVWTDFFSGSLLEIAKNKSNQILQKINKEYNKLKWFEVYDYVEFILLNHPNKTTKMQLKRDLLRLFKSKRVPYEIIGNKICPSEINDKEEIKEIEKTLNIPDKYKPVREHLLKALDKWADRKSPDYKNSIGESIKAVECLITILLGKEGTLGKLIDELDIHPALRAGFGNLYGWRSDESGVGHGKSKEPLSCGEPEARYMLVTCSAFINYVIIKFGVIK
jgi:hypothetical protein